MARLYKIKAKLRKSSKTSLPWLKHRFFLLKQFAQLIFPMECTLYS
jgi:hypothetical protein